MRPGFARAYSIKARKLSSLSSGTTTSICGADASSEIGARSFSAS